MKNFIKPGDVLTLTAPAGGVVSGNAVLIGSLLVIPQATVAVGEKFSGLAEGVVELPKLTTDVVTEGQKLNWNDTNKELQAATSDLDNVASVVEDAGNGDTLVKVKLTQV